VPSVYYHDVNTPTGDRKADEGKLQVKRQEMEKVRARFIHLLLTLGPPHLSLSRVTNIFIRVHGFADAVCKAVLLSPWPD